MSLHVDPGMYLFFDCCFESRHILFGCIAACAVYFQVVSVKIVKKMTETVCHTGLHLHDALVESLGHGLVHM